MSADEANKMEVKAFQSLKFSIVTLKNQPMLFRNYDIVINLCFQRNLQQTKGAR
jgi:predicted ribosome-associated RNA-binding protein Tma20